MFYLSLIDLLVIDFMDEEGEEELAERLSVEMLPLRCRDRYYQNFLNELIYLEASSTEMNFYKQRFCSGISILQEYPKSYPQFRRFVKLSLYCCHHFLVAVGKVAAKRMRTWMVTMMMKKMMKVVRKPSIYNYSSLVSSHMKVKTVTVKMTVTPLTVYHIHPQC